MSDTDSESLIDDNENNEIIEENTDSVEPESNQNNEKSTEKKNYKPKKRLVTSECGRQVIIQSKTKQKNKPIVVYLEDIMPEQEAPQVIVKTKRSKGRPKSKKIVEYVDKDGLPLDKKTKQASQTIINHPEPEKPLSDKDLELIKLQERIAELEQVSGRKILGTKKGKIDQRSVKPPTEKQLAARKKFAEAAKARHAKRRADKEAKKAEETKSNVKQVVSELQEIKKEALQKQKADELLKQKAIEEEKIRLAKEKEQSNPYNLDMFN